ncbi:hypothetical protein Y1Q_0003821 [Alligator mississippiensis]|uniref:Uncharacterized protein n=1 Tax=Alligator mississippiensis TaxID=8496 RepID=A0A151MNF7_ALLMI|nr:hypothetical protein Y1Q_0003821 [Alligator mississippiensis]
MTLGQKSRSQVTCITLYKLKPQASVDVRNETRKFSHRNDSYVLLNMQAKRIDGLAGSQSYIHVLEVLYECCWKMKPIKKHLQTTECCEV